MRKRVVFKNGDCNVAQEKVAKRKRRYLADIFTTLVDIQWRWNLLVFSMGFILSWLGFAVIWWLVCFTHGDLEHLDDANWSPCVQNIISFTSAFLFSIETQHTIGYGYRYIREDCPEAIFILCLQSIAGVMIQSFMVGVVFAKLSRPKKRAQTLLFSRNAVICQRDGRLCLMFRVGNMRKSHIIEAHVRAQLIRKKVTQEGELLPYYQYEVGFETGEDNIFFIWPITIVHVINERSPFYNLSARDLLRERFELVVILEGCIESTGMTAQARSSYLPNEIIWGHKFEQIVSFRKDTGEYQVDYSQFNTTCEIDTPLCSARELAEYQRMHNQGTETPPEQKGAFGKPARLNQTWMRRELGEGVSPTWPQEAKPRVPPSLQLWPKQGEDTTPVQEKRPDSLPIPLVQQMLQRRDGSQTDENRLSASPELALALSSTLQRLFERQQKHLGSSKSLPASGFSTPQRGSVTSHKEGEGDEQKEDTPFDV